MAVKYTIPFDSNTGSEIEYELDILDNTFVGSATSLKCQAEPIEITWKQDDDVYAPIIGSQARINLLLESGDTIDDFNAGAQYRYEARLRWKDSSDVLHDIWRGFIDPTDGNERLGSFPLPVTYIATDGLGSIEGVVRAPNNRSSVLLLHYILDALEATGLGLDVRIDSSIVDLNSNDALTTATVDEKAFLSSDTRLSHPDNADTKKEVLEGILAAFNCSVRQSNGIFYIVNNSRYEGSGSNESVTWAVYTYSSTRNPATSATGTRYASATAVTENVRYEIDGNSTGDLYIANEGLYLIPRRPYGSVECRFQKLRPLNAITNPNFDADTTGWATHSSSVDSSLTITSTGGLNGSKAIRTIRNRGNSDNNAEIWFQTASATASEISRDFRHKLKFAWHADISDSNGKSVDLKYQVFAVFPSNISQTKFQGSSNWLDWVAAIFGNSSNLSTTVTSNTIYHNFSDEKWKLNDKGTEFWDWSAITGVATIKGGGWFEEEIDLGKIGNTLLGPGGGASFPDGKPDLYIRFMYPELKNDSGKSISAGTNKVTVTIDDISVIGQYEGDDLDVVFERAQTNYTNTLEYKPNIIGSDNIDQEFYEIISLTDLWEDDQTPSSDAARGLEQIVTNQKLKDNREQFYYYQAELINNNTIPFGLHNKVKLSLSNENRSTSMIPSGGKFLPKSNRYSINMYEPNQVISGTDNRDYATFEERNITLVGTAAPVRDTITQYVIGINLNITDDDGTAQADGASVTNIVADRKGPNWILVEGLPGEQKSVSFDIVPGTDWELDGTPTLVDTNTNPAPVIPDSTTIERIGTVTRVRFDIILPEEDEYETARFDVNVDELVGNNSRVILSATDSMTNATLDQGTSAITEIGPVGGTERFYYYVQPSALYQMTTSALTVTLNSVKDGDNSTDTDVSGVITSTDIRKIKAGNGVLVEIPFKYVETSPVYAKLTFSGTATLLPTTTTVTAQLSVTEAGSDTSNWSITDSSHTYTCIPGTPLRYAFEVNPGSGRSIPEGNVSVGSLEESWLGSYYVTSAGETNTEATVWVDATCPSSNSTAAATINATTTTGTSGDTLNSYQITWTDPTNGDINNSGSNVTLQLEDGQTAEFILSVEADTGYRIGTLAIDTSNLPTGLTYSHASPGTYANEENVDFHFLVTGQSADDTGNSIPFSGAIASGNNKYVHRINLNIGTANNAQLSRTYIDIPYGDADLGDTDTGTDPTFTVQASENRAAYTATGNISYSSSNTTLLDSANDISATISSGVITVTIDEFTLPTTAPTNGLSEVTLTINGPASEVPSVEVDWQGLSGPSTVSGTNHIIYYFRWSAWLEKNYACSDTANSSGGLPRYGDIYTFSTGVSDNPSGVNTNEGWQAQYSCGNTLRDGRRRVNGFLQYRVNDGAVEAHDSATARVTFTHPTDSNEVMVFDATVPTKGLMGTATSGASGYDVKQFRTLTTTEYNALASTDNNTFYFLID